MPRNDDRRVITSQLRVANRYVDYHMFLNPIAAAAPDFFLSGLQQKAGLQTPKNYKPVHFQNLLRITNRDQLRRIICIERLVGLC